MEQKIPPSDKYINIVVLREETCDCRFYPTNINLSDGIGFQLCQKKRNDGIEEWFTKMYSFEKEKFTSDSAPVTLAQLGLPTEQPELADEVNKNVYLYAAPKVGRVHGIAIKPGKFTGIDGHTINWTRDKLLEYAPSIIGTRLKFQPPGIKRHSDNANSVIGWLDGYQVHPNGEVRYSASVFDRNALTEIKAIQDAAGRGDNDPLGNSIEATVTLIETATGELEPETIKFTAVELLPRPACPTCRVDYVEEIKMGNETTPATIQMEDVKALLAPFQEKIKELETKTAKLSEDLLAEQENSKQAVDRAVEQLKLENLKQMYDLQYAETKRLDEHRKAQIDAALSAIPDEPPYYKGRLLLLEEYLKMAKTELINETRAALAEKPAVEIKNEAGELLDPIKAIMKATAQEMGL